MEQLEPDITNTALQVEIAERQRAEQALRASEQAFHLLTANVVDYAIFLLDPTGHVVTWNVGAQRLKQYRADEIIGRHFSQFYTPEDIALGKPARWLDHARREGRVHDEGWRLRKDGSRFWADVVITALYDEHHQLRGFAKVTRDMTERRQAEEQLRESNERLRLLTGHLQTAREDERMTIARELHDELGQLLSVAKMDLFHLAKRLSKAQPSDPPPLSRVVTDLYAVIGTIDESIRSARRMVHELRPISLSELGLRETLESQTLQFQERTGIACTFNSNAGDIPLEDERAIGLYRIFQESLNNVARHAQATRVAITLTVSGNELLLAVQDDGRGIQPGALEKAGHFGLLGMKERAILLGGDVAIIPASGGGTLVTLRVPLA